jgi:tRNA (mo5U34)-methyltransferase
MVHLPATGYTKVLDDYERLRQDFELKISAIDFPGLERFLWYHTIDLENGLITPGQYDYRQHLDYFSFPENMSGMHVLDIGSATGFFSFEFARRGANVTSVELPSIDQWDMPTAEDKEITLKELMEVHHTTSIEELQYLHLEGPFQFCQKMLAANVNRVHSSIYDLSLERLKGQQFDLVFLGDILLHIFSPFAALSRVAPLCRGTLIISQNMPGVVEDQPVMLYLGGDSRRGDNRTWWYPNKTCFDQMLKRLGFQTIRFVGDFEIVHRPTGGVSRKTVIHAQR